MFQTVPGLGPTYYHVLIEVKNFSDNKEVITLFEYDSTSKQDIIGEILVSYLKKEDFQFNGYFLKANEVSRLLVKITSEPIQNIVDRENSELPDGFFIFTQKEHIFNDNKYTKNITKEILKEAKVFLENEIKTPQILIDKVEEVDRSKVFIVHGHDEAVKLAVARFLEKLKLTPIILHEQASSGRTIIEKIEEYSNVGFGIVLYTPCDLGAAKDSREMKLRARQNVVFEHGYLISKIGRANVCALVKDDIEKPNDISGVVYVNYDSHGGWHGELLKELISSGYDVDANLIYKT